MVGSRVLAVRLGVLVAVAAGLQVGPVLHQVLGLRTPPLLMAWSMYSGVGRDLCTVRWTGPPVEGAGGERFLRSPDAVRAAAAVRCGESPGTSVEAWCPAPDGRWVRAVGPEEPLCR